MQQQQLHVVGGSPDAGPRPRYITRDFQAKLHVAIGAVCWNEKALLPLIARHHAERRRAIDLCLELGGYKTIHEAVGGDERESLDSLTRARSDSCGYVYVRALRRIQYYTVRAWFCVVCCFDSLLMCLDLGSIGSFQWLIASRAARRICSTGIFAHVMSWSWFFFLNLFLLFYSRARESMTRPNSYS